MNTYDTENPREPYVGHNSQFTVLVKEPFPLRATKVKFFTP